MRKRQSITALVLGIIGALLVSTVALAQDSPSGSAATDAAPVVFDVGVDSDITSLNPFNLCCGPDYEVMGLMYDLAIGFDNASLEAAPEIVSSWEHSDDYMDWTMNVVEGATFNDGEPLTAEDVAFTFAFISDNKMPFYKDYFPFEPTFEVVSDTQLIWHAKEPTFAPEVPAYAPVLPEHIWGQFNDAEDPKKAAKEFTNDNPVGSGPFELVEYADGERIHLRVRDNYWNGQPASLDEIVFHIYENKETMTSALKNGELDFAYGLNATLYNSLEGEPNIGRHAGNAGCWGNIAWNFGGQAGGNDTADPVVHELAFRQAMAHAIDRQQIVDRVYQGTAANGYSILMPSPNGSWVADIPEELRFNYDPEQAKSMLDSAGIVDTNGDGNREYQGQEINLEMLTITDVDGSVDTGKLLKEYWEAVGISSFFTTVNTNKAYAVWGDGTFDVYVWDWCPDPDPDFMLSVFTTDQCNGWSDGCYSNPEYDELYQLQQTQLDRAERKATIDEMQLIIAEEIPTMVLNYWTTLEAWRTDRFEGYELSPADNGTYLLGYTNYNYMNIVPVGSGAATGSASSGLPGWVWIAVAIGVVLIVVAVVMSRRRSDAEEA
jgi:peptide/nickel transport system substrate-binding protein